MKSRQKNKKEFILISLILMITTWSSACIPTANIGNTETSEPPTPTLTMVSTVRIPEQKLTVTSTPTKISTITPLPPIDAEELEGYIIDLMETNGSCRLPCWWGMTPGETSMENVHQFLEHLDVKIYESVYKDIYTVYSPDLRIEKFSDFYYWNNFIETNEQLDSIVAVGEEYPPSEYFKSFWRAYLPVEIFKTYGEPTRIFLSAPGMSGIGNTGNTGYEMWIVYDHLGFMIRYDGVVRDLPVYEICPTFQKGSGQISRVDIYMQSPSNSNPLELTDSILKSEDMLDGSVKTIQEATGLTNKEFYDLLTHDEDLPCFTTPHDIWPKK